MQFKRITAVILLAVSITVTVGSCAQKAPLDQRSFILSESISLAQEMQDAGSQFFPELDPSAVPNFQKGLENADMSSPDGAVVITVDPDFVVDFFDSFQQIELSDYSDELIDFFAPKTITGLTSLVFAVLVDQGYSIQSISTSGIFSTTHLKKAPDGFGNASVFMSFGDCTAITGFSRYGDSISCTCYQIIPDMSADELLDIYIAFFEDSYGTNLLDGHTEAVDAAGIRGIIG